MHFNLIPKKFAISVSVRNDGISESIELVTNIDPWRDFNNNEGQSLKSVEWHVSLHRGDRYNDYAEDHNAIGTVVFANELSSEFEHFPMRFFAGCAVSSEQFDRLSSQLACGLVINGINLELEGEGIRFGYAPDGSEVIWDVASFHNAVIKTMSTSVSREWGNSESAPSETEIYVSQDQTASPKTDSALQEILTSMKLRLGLIAATLVLLTLIIIVT